MIIVSLFWVVFVSAQTKTHMSLLGKGRGEFALPGGLQVPFNFDIAKGKDGHPVLYFLNGDERFEGGAVQQKDDSLFVNLDLFGNVLALKAAGTSLEGFLRKQDGQGQELPVTATMGRSDRFTERGPAPAGNVSGTYSVVFKAPDGREEQAVALFQQQGRKLKGTFLRITGDSRFLQGVVEKDSFRLSSFIGSGPVYFRGRFSNNGTIIGEQVGTRSTVPFTGVPNEEAALPDPYGLTYLKNGYSSLDFTFPNAEGKPVSLKDPKYQGKVVIVTIAGTWCPNCIDEASFLSPWYKKNRERGVEIISIHYERQTDTAFVRKALQRFRQRFNIEYDQLFGGRADKSVVAASLPALNTFLSFPTTILIDKKGKVAKIHTGYSGPATGKYYTAFVKEFNEEVDKLLKGGNNKVTETEKKANSASR
jgi:peroxiredoxin